MRKDYPFVSTTYLTFQEAKAAEAIRRAKEEAEELKHYRKSLAFKVRPMPVAYLMILNELFWTCRKTYKKVSLHGDAE